MKKKNYELEQLRIKHSLALPNTELLCAALGIVLCPGMFMTVITVNTLFYVLHFSLLISTNLLINSMS